MKRPKVNKQFKTSFGIFKLIKHNEDSGKDCQNCFFNREVKLAEDCDNFCIETNKLFKNEDINYDMCLAPSNYSFKKVYSIKSKKKLNILK